jgi:hypothetical protein
VAKHPASDIAVSGDANSHHIHVSFSDKEIDDLDNAKSISEITEKGDGLG